MFSKPRLGRSHVGVFYMDRRRLLFAHRGCHAHMWSRLVCLRRSGRSVWKALYFFEEMNKIFFMMFTVMFAANWCNFSSSPKKITGDHKGVLRVTFTLSSGENHVASPPPLLCALSTADHNDKVRNLRVVLNPKSLLPVLRDRGYFDQYVLKHIMHASVRAATTRLWWIKIIN